jgi:cytochrome c oxidase subunit 3
MEALPYTVHPREDTGLYNAKVGIWLFLASEVMLFGALFSAYVLLRVGAAPGTWPHGLLNIPIGTVNTLVLITSSVTVVMAWASLKLNQFGKFKFYQAITILCACTFVGIKSYEYRDKFTHYAVTLNDGSSMTGHIEGNPLFWNLDKLNNPAHPVKEFTMHVDPVVPAAHHGDASAEEHGAEAGHGEHQTIKIETANIKKLECFGPWHSTYLAIYFTLTALHALHVIGGALVIGFLWGPGSKMWKTDPERFTNRIEISGLFWHFVDLVWIFLFPVLYLL